MMKSKILLLMLFLLYTQILSAKNDNNTTTVNIKNSIVKIFTVANVPDYGEPWSSHIKEFTGSGCIISGQRILTNAHVVTDYTYVEVLKNGETKRYEAEILSIAHESDLALITVKDKSFFDNTNSLEFGELPELQEKISVYGFPRGGDTLSITNGVVSRIEHQVYVHSKKYHLAIQIDAAINAGNSGGPALSNGKIVGLVMQGKTSAENIGYIIPVSVIKHYFEDIKDGKYDGYPALGILTQTLESPVMKEMYGLKGKKLGVRIRELVPNSPGSKVLKAGDIMIAVDNFNIYSNYKVEFRDKEFTDYAYVSDMYQMGESIDFTILRDRKEKRVTLFLDKKKDDLTFIKNRKPESKLSYYIYGGLVFVPGLKQYYLPSKYHRIYPDEEREELVVLKRVLSSPLTKGYRSHGFGVVETVNGKGFKNFKEFVNLLESSKEKYIVFENEYYRQMVVKREDVLKTQNSILKKYNIKAAKSDDLQIDKKEKALVLN